MTDAYAPVPEDALVVPVAVIPVRAEPAHRSELVSQWILGEVVDVRETRGSWLRAAGPDGYTGWTPLAPFRRSVVDAGAWRDGDLLRSHGCEIADADGAAGRVPWGGLVRPAGGRDVALPDGRVVTPTSASCVHSAAAGSGDAARVVSLAREWMGVPYLWGGRTELGVDCSGFAQAVFASVGVGLPRDSGQQAVASADISGSDARRPADLLFFAPEGDEVTHVAIVVAGSRIIHAASSNGAVVEDDLEATDPLAALLAESVVARTRPLAAGAGSQSV